MKVCTIGLILGFLLLLTVQAVVAENVEYVTEWPAWQPIDNPRGIATDLSGNVYVADTRNSIVLKFDGNGNFISKIGAYGEGAGQFRDPAGIAVSTGGDIYVTDSALHQVTKFSSSGAFIRSWGSFASTPGPNRFSNPDGIAVDHEGNVYVVDGSNSNNVQKFTSDGTFLLSWGGQGTTDGKFNNPTAIAIDSANNVLVLDSGNNRVQKFSKQGAYISQWAASGNSITIDKYGNVYIADNDQDTIKKYTFEGGLITSWSSRPDGTGGPLAIAASALDYLYVVDNTQQNRNDRIEKYSLDGQKVASWGDQNSADGQFNTPTKIAVDRNRYVYVVDSGNYRIQKFDPSGQFVLKWGGFGTGAGQFFNPYAITIDNNNNIYVTDSHQCRVQKFDSNGQFLLQWGSEGADDGQFKLFALGIASDKFNNIYVTDSIRVQKFSSSGVYLKKWGSEGSGQGQFSSPYGIAVDDSLNVFVADTNNHRIQKFSSEGSFISSWGTNGGGSGQFRSPEGVSVGTGGYVYVADTWNNRIQKFDSTGRYLASFGGLGSGNGQMRRPSGLGLNSDGTKMYVADTLNGRVEQFHTTSTSSSPIADFTATPTSGSVLSTFSFTDTSTGNPTSWSWTFGDGGTSTLQHPSHVYVTPGTYTVSLTVRNSLGGSNTKTRYAFITVGSTGDPSWYIPHILPTTIQAEDYDTDGAGNAYLDTTAANLGGAYRSDGVDIEAIPGGYTVCYIREGEWTKYSVDSPTAATYLLTMRAGRWSTSPASTVEVQVDGTTQQTVTVPYTGSSSVFTTAPYVQVTVPAGRHTVTLKYHGGNMNLDWVNFALQTQPSPSPSPSPTITFQQLPYPGSHSAPGRVEAENYDSGGQGIAYFDTTAANEGGAGRLNEGVDVEAEGGAVVVAYIRAGEYLDYSVDVDATSAGMFRVAARYTNPSGSKTVSVKVDGATATTISLPATGRWGAWATATSGTFMLPAGRHVVTIDMGSASSFNLDYLDFQRAGSVMTTTTTATTATTISTQTTMTTSTTTTTGIGSATFVAVPTSTTIGRAVKFTLTPAAGKTISSVRWSFDADSHLNTWNSRSTNPTFYYPVRGTFSPLAAITYTDGSVENIKRSRYISVA